MQAAIDKRAERMLRAHEARLNGEMTDTSKIDVDASLEALNNMRLATQKTTIKGVSNISLHYGNVAGLLVNYGDISPYTHKYKFD